MSASDSAAGHAVRPDGRLKDTSEMEWTYDKDESIPFPSSTPAVSTSDNTGSSSSIPLESARIHPFFTQGKPPAVIVAGSRCSARTSRPSQRVQEATEVSSLAAGSTSAKPTTGSKRKAAESSPGPAHWVARKVVIDSDDEHDGNETEPADVDENGSDIETTTYQSLKAMADADDEVMCYLNNYYIVYWYFPLLGNSLQVQRRQHRWHLFNISARKGIQEPSSGKTESGNTR